MKRMGEKRTVENVGDKLRAFYRVRGRMPSFAEFAKAIGVKSKNAVSGWVGKITEGDILRADTSGRLAKGEYFDGVKILGLIEAGFPTGSEETFTERQSLDDFLITRKEASYLL